MKTIHNIFKRTLIFFTALLLPLLLTAQNNNYGRITGTVTDQKGNTIPYAKVSLQNTDHRVMTNLEGQFVFEKIKAGTYKLKTVFMGFLPHTQELSVKPNETTVSQISLLENVKELNEVVVEAEKTEKQQIHESGFAVNSIETEEASLQSIQTNELLDRSAGVRIRQTGGLGSRVQYNLNGLSGNSVRIFIDGVPISNYGPSFSLNSIPASMIERIDVYKGVVPAHLSSDALGGAINIILKKSIKNTLQASYSYGSFNTHQTNINGGYRNPKNGFTARASLFHNYSDNSYKVWGEKIYVTEPSSGEVKKITAKRFHDSYQSYGTKVDVGFSDVKWADQLMLGVVLSDMTNEIQHGATMEVVYGNRRATQNTKLFSLQYSKEDFLIKKLDFSFTSSYSHLKRQTIDTIPYMFNWYGEQLDYKWSSGAEGSSPTLQIDTERKYNTRANVSYRITPNHKIGVNYLIDGFARDQDDAVLSQVERDLKETRFLTKSVISGSIDSKLLKGRFRSSIFAKHYRQQVKITDRSKERSGVITETNHDRDVPLTGYGIALSYKLLPKLMITGSYENAVRMPTGNEMLGNNAENINPSYSLKPEQSNNFNAGFSIEHVNLKKHHFNFTTNFFYRETRDMIRQGIPTQVSETYEFENLESILSKGVDLSLRYNYSEKLYIVSGFSVFNARFNTQFDPSGTEYSYYGARLRNEPYFTSNTNLRYYFKNLVQKDNQVVFYYNFAYIHQFLRDWEGVGSSNKPIIPTQLIHDLGVAYTLPNKKLTFSFDAKNIFNRQVFDNWALQKPGRAFYFKITYQLI